MKTLWQIADWLYVGKSQNIFDCKQFTQNRQNISRYFFSSNLFQSSRAWLLSCLNLVWWCFSFLFWLYKRFKRLKHLNDKLDGMSSKRNSFHTFGENSFCEWRKCSIQAISPLFSTSKCFPNLQSRLLQRRLKSNRP